MSDDLVKRLRGTAQNFPETKEDLLLEAAQSIEAQQTEIARLRRVLEHDQWSVVNGALARWTHEDGSDLVALGIIGRGVIILNDARRTALEGK